ncbi:helix-turn-helix domain-containing protein [Kineococcus rhizosphaerae]|uniref:Uncharacterized protein n=1 Tax=Kineococcus rhizosphaerae TaxID=559628 RepID=A0A2T0R243_9ACTN|nr:helix-turn-helix transcriptional regulator [Kineococcus rhizosphaerae]PRY13600.1 hypothetical protein CLV37_108270 [Kineococcus rhizosphaerae]
MTRADAEVPADVWEELHDLASEPGGERNIARHLRDELSRRGWSQEAFAAKVRDEGLPYFRQSAISRILKPQGEPRAITVEEACAFARVLDLPVALLFAPEGVVQNMKVARYLRDLPTLWSERVEAEIRHEEAEGAILRFLESEDDGVPGLREAITERLDKARRARAQAEEEVDGEFFGTVTSADDHLLDEWEKRSK